MPFKRKGPKRYGERSTRQINKDIREERRSLKEGGGTRAEVKEYNKYQRMRKKQIRAEVKRRK